MMTFDLLSWGANSHHQLGHGVESEQCLSPMAVNLNSIGLRPSDITKATGGAGHSLLLNTKGEVYSCGWNSKGQLGIPGAKNCMEKFERIEEFRGLIIVDIACGWDSSMAIDNHGHLYAWGSNVYGQLGVATISGDEKSARTFSRPKKVRIPREAEDAVEDPVAKIAMGLRHAAVVTASGKVFVAGHGGKCQLGITDSSNKPLRKADTFTRVPELSRIKTVACGQHHTIVLTKEGDLYAWGDNKHGQLGFDISTHPSISKPLKLENINLGLDGEIFTGWTHTAALYDGKILAWGRNTYGQLGCWKFNGFEQIREQEFMESVPKFIQLAVGSEHNIALTGDGSILCWGWNEHGNCGTGNDQDVRVPVRVEIPKNGRGTLVGTGYGHSLAVVQN